MTRTLELTRALIDIASITPDDAGCQQLLASRLEPLGFKAEWLPFGDVSNVIFTHGHAADCDGPSLWFLGHTDVVPPGPLDDWTSPPFASEVRDGALYGRGAADMKGAVAAMVVAAETLVAENPEHHGQVGIMLTSDEEGDAVDGIKRVADVLRERQSVPDFCLVGEPSSSAHLGDVVRIGRRGSTHARLKVHGIQGHSAFPDKLDNPIHRLSAFLHELTTLEWDRGDENFPPTHCQVTNFHAGTGAENVTPGHAHVLINFRNCPESPSPDIKQRFVALLSKHGINDYDLEWWLSGEAFRSPAGALRDAVVRVIREDLGAEPDLNTGGGTSDGRFIAPLGSEVVEFGLLNESIHKVDENTSVDDLEALTRAYLRIMQHLLSG